MDRIDHRIGTQKMCKFFFQSMTNKDIIWYNKCRKQLVLIVEEIRT